MVGVLAIGNSVRGLKPGRGDGFFRAIKIRSTSSFRGEVFRDPGLLLGGSAGRIVKERCGGRIRSFLLSSFHHGCPCACITWEMTVGPLLVEVQRHGLTPSA
jgi:hypothetical protein